MYFLTHKINLTSLVLLNQIDIKGIQIFLAKIKLPPVGIESTTD